MSNIPQLGIIEGYYGKPWRWEDRAHTVAYLKPHGYDFFMYAPKAEPFLRLRWQEDFTAERTNDLKQLAQTCRNNDVRFGIGISPVIKSNFDATEKAALQRKLEAFDDIGTDDVAILFDDMTGANPDMARQQADVVHWAAARTNASRVIMCPSYYTDDPVLDRVFGARPQNYVEDIGQYVDGRIEIFWTGEEVCSRQIGAGHIDRVTEQLRRKPFLWDNYPVNDGARMSQYLHVRGFTGRDPNIADRIAAHGVNPALQPTLSLIPCLTLTQSYTQKQNYEYATAMKSAAIDVAYEKVGTMLWEDALFLQDVGLDRLGEREQMLRERYGGEQHPAAKEVIGWLNGEYRITDALIRAMAGNEQG